MTAKWERDGDLIKLHIDKAEGVKGDIVLPKNYVFVSKDGVPDVIMKGRRVYALESGTYVTANSWRK